MFKKTLVATALLGAIGAAGAADFTLYGVIDTSLIYEGVDAKDGAGRDHYLYMSSGEEWGSRWGIRGSEDLGNGYSVGFDLQSGIRTDNGALAYSPLFGREASLHVKGPFGKLTFGRMDALIGTRSSAGFMAVLTSWGDGYGPYNPSLANVVSERSFIDNAVFYESPKLSGFTFRLQYSMGPDGAENESNNLVASDGTVTEAKRYAAGTAMYQNGPLTLFFGVDTTLYGHAAGEDVDNSITVTAGGNYDFGPVRVYGGVQYFDEVPAGSGSSIRGLSWTLDGVERVPNRLKGFGATVSAAIPLFGGRLMPAISYLNAEAADGADAAYSDTDVTRLIGGLGYQYDLSARTHLYVIASVGQDEIKAPDRTDKPNYYKAGLGIRHLF